MIESLVSSPTIDLLERSLSFTEQRHQVILANIANVSTPGYVQQDVSVAGFQESMRDAVERRRESNNEDALQPESNDDVQFSADGSQMTVIPHDSTSAMPFHDGGVRTMEQLMGDLADNAEAHNAIAQMLSNRYGIINDAIQMKA